MNAPLHTMSLTELRATRRALANNPSKRSKKKRQAMILACDAWIRKRVKEKKAK